MPSNTQRIVAAMITAGLFVSGAWLASGFRIELPETSASSTEGGSDHGLIVNLHGARSDKGQLIVVAFDKAEPFDAFDEYAAAGYVYLPATTAPQRVDFPDLTSPHYAVVAYHDENGDFQLNVDDAWIPTEGYAVSGMNDLYDDPVFEYALIRPDDPADLVFFYWDQFAR